MMKKMMKEFKMELMKKMKKVYIIMEPYLPLLSPSL